MYALVACALAAAPSAYAQEKERCNNGKGTAERQVSGFWVRVLPTAHPEDLGVCEAQIRSPEGKIVFHASDWATTINDASGKSISGSGKPEVVIEGYSGGAHCCWTYWIVALEPEPRLLRKIYNDESIAFEDLDRDGRIELVMLDGAFDYFDGLCHACSLFPLVALRLKGTKLERVDAEYWPHYEKKIAEAKANLEPRCAKLFHDGKLKSDKETEGCNFAYTKGTVLQIVLANLYGGREKDAWKALDEYWPPEDLARIRKLIAETARGSFLGDPSDPKYGNR